MEIYEHLTAQQCFEVVAYDPHVEAAFVEKNLAVAINNADLILVLTDHSAFREMDSTTFENMNQKKYPRHKKTFLTCPLMTLIIST